MADFTYRFTWRKDDPTLIRDAREFWRKLDVLSPEEMDKREKELCALAYMDGKVAAVATVFPFDFPRLRSRFAYYRTMVAEEYRRQNLASKLCSYSRHRLAEWAHENPEEKLRGLFIVLQAEEFRHRQHVPIGTQLDFKLVLVGYTPTGYQMRVVWFDDATVD